ncbi:S1C family serine protease [Falsibacillus albus]|uniref:Serine protease n=1 Tax=Falsibacillus albus TaxID=2478915 RepID=A0A3L7JT33_9BACI|nr:S1C family serine protease [Falsibacillus albus]RLQ93993.1 serine protease [Falsibacillus albus]
MGYYDQDSENRYKEKQKGNKGGIFLASLVGVILGAILILVALPKLADVGVLPYNIQPDEQLSQTDKAFHGKQENVSLNVTTDVTKAVKKASPAVVGITNLQTTDFWSQEDQPASTGSGVIYKKEGGKAYIVTNNHVVEGADQLEVTLTDGSKEKAKLRGADPFTDLAVVEIDGSKVKQVAEFGNSDALKPGEPVMAIGNPLGEQFASSVTQGIISGLERTIPVDVNKDGQPDWQAQVLQTDAAINPGNSGGALVNIDGQVVGINSMKIAQTAVEGIGLSIPINYAKPIISDLEKYGKLKRPAMGVGLRDVSEIPAYHQQETLKLPKDVKDGVVVVKVYPNTPADQAGLKELDVITELDGKPVKNILELRKYLYDHKKIGDQMKVTYYRGGKKEETTIKLTGESQL